MYCVSLHFQVNFFELPHSIHDNIVVYTLIL